MDGLGQKWGGGGKKENKIVEFFSHPSSLHDSEPDKIRPLKVVILEKCTNPLRWNKKQGRKIPAGLVTTGPSQGQE